jgi:transposase
MARRIWAAGIDVGKQRLDIALWSKTPRTLQVDRNADGFARLIDWLREHNVVRVGLEASGGYEREVLDRLDDAGFVTVPLNPRQVRQFARATGRLAKNDRIDARTIAGFVAKMINEDPARWDRSWDLLIEHLGFRRQIQGWIEDCDNLLEHRRDPPCAMPPRPGAQGLHATWPDRTPNSPLYSPASPTGPKPRGGCAPCQASGRCSPTR